MVSTKKLLSGGFYEVERFGQQLVCEGDDVEVRVTVYLPCDDRGELRSDLRFEARLLLIGEYLGSSWGVYEHDVNTDHRFKRLVFSAKKWASAFENATTAGDELLDRLEIMLDDRAQALIDAEKP